MSKHLLLKLSLLLVSSNLLMAQDLVHYWNFNTSTTLNELLTPTSSKVASAGIQHTVGTSTSTVEFASNSSQDFGTLNARNAEDALSHLRFNNPVGGELVFSLPTTGYIDPIVKYVTRRSTQSARAQIVSYTIDGINYVRFDSLAITEIPTLITLDFSSIAAADNNANFKIKFAFVQVAGNGAGNNRFDNFSVDATSASSGNVAPTVLKVQVISDSSIRVIFDRDLDATSATNTANFSNIAGLASISCSQNGAAPDTLLLTYSTPFAQGSSNTLVINNVKDAANNPMVSPFTFEFTYNSTVAFDKVFYTVKEDAGSLKIMLKLTNPTTSSVDVVVKVSPWSTATNTDFTLATKTHSFTGSSNSMVEITIPIIKDTENENDEYFVLSLENATGLSIAGGTFATIYIKDNDKKAPVASKEIELELVTSFDPATTASTTEAISYEPVTKRIYAISAVQKRVDIIDFSNPAAPSTIKTIDMTPYGGVTSIAAKNGILAVGSPNANEQLAGSVVLFDLEGTFKKQLTVGALPDFVCFTPDGSKILTADEGQPNTAYTVDPEGSVSVVNISVGINNISQSDVTTISFASLNTNEATLLAKGIRKTASFSTLAQDLEPEYITVSPDSKKAWVVLQENNAMMEINLTDLTITSVWPLGTKDYSLAENGADFSTSNGEILITNFPVKGYYMPDAIANYTVNGTTYIVTANEGDEKEYSLVNERAAVSSNPIKLDFTKFPNATVLKQTHNLGNFRISNLQGDTDKDGDFDELYAVGSRSFSIFNASNGSLVYDSGDDFEYITAQHPTFSALFNSNHEENKLKGRSNAKGCEPEALTIAELNGQKYAFVGLERIGGVMVYNITDPEKPVFVDYKNNRSTTAYTGDHGPEYVVHVKGSESPDGKDYILVSNEISGTITVFGLQNVITSTEENNMNNYSFNIYPNPVKGTKLNLSQTSDVTLETINGQKVMEATNTNSLDISQFNKGLYILKTTEGFTRKFMVE